MLCCVSKCYFDYISIIFLLIVKFHIFTKLFLYFTVSVCAGVGAGADCSGQEMEETPGEGRPLPATVLCPRTLTITLLSRHQEASKKRFSSHTTQSLTIGGKYFEFKVFHQSIKE